MDDPVLPKLNGAVVVTGVVEKLNGAGDDFFSFEPHEKVDAVLLNVSFPSAVEREKNDDDVTGMVEVLLNRLG